MMATETAAGAPDAAGRVVGSSKRYNGGATELGSNVWFYNGATTTIIGLTGAEHTSSSGVKSSFNVVRGAGGQVLGESSRFNGGSTNLGQSLWLYNGVTTIDVGLTDSEYTRNDGYKSSSAGLINSAGQFIGALSDTTAEA